MSTTCTTVGFFNHIDMNFLNCKFSHFFVFLCCNVKKYCRGIDKNVCVMCYKGISLFLSLFVLQHHVFMTPWISIMVIISALGLPTKVNEMVCFLTWLLV